MIMMITRMLVLALVVAIIDRMMSTITIVIAPPFSILLPFSLTVLLILSGADLILSHLPQAAGMPFKEIAYAKLHAKCSRLLSMYDIVYTIASGSFLAYLLANNSWEPCRC